MGLRGNIMPQTENLIPNCMAHEGEPGVYKDMSGLEKVSSLLADCRYGKEFKKHGH